MLPTPNQSSFQALQNSFQNRTLMDVSRGDVEFHFTYEGAGCASHSQVLPASAVFSVRRQVGFLDVTPLGVFYSPISPDKPTVGAGEFSMG